MNRKDDEPSLAEQRYTQMSDNVFVVRGINVQIGPTELANALAGIELSGKKLIHVIVFPTYDPLPYGINAAVVVTEALPQQGQ